MKKFLFIALVAVSIAAMSCGQSKVSKGTDSTSDTAQDTVQVDSTSKI